VDEHGIREREKVFYGKVNANATVYVVTRARVKDGGTVNIGKTSYTIFNTAPPNLQDNVVAVTYYPSVRLSNVIRKQYVPPKGITTLPKSGPDTFRYCLLSYRLMEKLASGKGGVGRPISISPRGVGRPSKMPPVHLETAEEKDMMDRIQVHKSASKVKLTKSGKVRHN
jgi:hypothetical protein